MHFGFILLLALGAVIDSHVELRRTDVEVKSHEKSLMEVVILRKLRPVAFEVLLEFIGSSSPRVFTQNRFSQFSPIHKLGEFQQ
jgi:predicted component of type VI protein secretion system